MRLPAVVVIFTSMSITLSVVVPERFPLNVLAFPPNTIVSLFWVNKLTVPILAVLASVTLLTVMSPPVELEPIVKTVAVIAPSSASARSNTAPAVPTKMLRLFVAVTVKVPAPTLSVSAALITTSAAIISKLSSLVDIVSISPLPSANVPAPSLSLSALKVLLASPPSLIVIASLISMPFSALAVKAPLKVDVPAESLKVIVEAAAVAFKVTSFADAGVVTVSTVIEPPAAALPMTRAPAVILSN